MIYRESAFSQLEIEMSISVSGEIIANGTRYRED